MEKSKQGRGQRRNLTLCTLWSIIVARLGGMLQDARRLRPRLRADLAVCARGFRAHHLGWSICKAYICTVSSRRRKFPRMLEEREVVPVGSKSEVKQVIRHPSQKIGPSQWFLTNVD